jgi:hypothetical protein
MPYGPQPRSLAKLSVMHARAPAQLRTLMQRGNATIDNPAARNCFLDDNHEFINRFAVGHQPGPGQHDLRNDVLMKSNARNISNIA